MGRRSALEVVVLLAALLMAARPAQLSPEEAAYRLAKAACDRGGDWLQVQKTVDDILARFPDSDSQWIWGVRVLRARPLIGLGRNEQAVALLAPELPPKLRRSEPAVRRLLFRAFALNRVTPRVDPEPSLQEAWQIATNDQPHMRAEVMFIRCSIATDTDRAAAERYGHEAARLAAQLKQPDIEVKALAALARIYGLNDQFDAAIRSNERAFALAKQRGMDGLFQQLLINLAWQYDAIGEPVIAEERVRAAEELATRYHAESDLLTCLMLRGNFVSARRDYVAGNQFYRRAFDLALKLKDPRAGQAMANLALNAVNVGDWPFARRYNAQALLLKRAARDTYGELRSLVLDGRIAAGQKQYADAESIFRKVLGAATSKSVRWETQARLADVLAARGRNEQADAAYREALRGVGEARDDFTSEERKLSFPSTIAHFYDSYVDFLVAAGRHDDALRVAEESRANTLAEALGLGDERTRAGDVPRAAKGTVALSYWLGATSSYLWAVTDRGAQFFKLPPEREIAAAVEQYQKELMGLGGGALTSARGQKLYRMLVEPAASAIGAQARVAIVPDGRLSSFNFETVIVPTPKPRFWIEDVIIETTPSLEFLAASRGHGASSASAILVMGNPSAADPAYPPLPRAGIEIQRIGKHFPNAKTIVGAQATPRAYAKGSPGQYAFLHFVAHGTASSDRPLDSAVILSRDADGYKLYAREIMRHPLNARLVTISSCHGAGRREYAGEGLVGLAWSFLRAGAGNVVAALWEVSDHSTPQLMDAMYAGLRRNEDPATALRKAKLELLHSAGAFRKPFYWAPFVLYSGT